jgi:hypothetical protein
MVEPPYDKSASWTFVIIARLRRSHGFSRCEEHAATRRKTRRPVVLLNPSWFVHNNRAFRKRKLVRLYGED